MPTEAPQPNVGIALAAFRPNISFLVEQLTSIQSQDYRNWFCIITLDSELAPLKEEPRLNSFFEDARFTWVQNEERLGPARNFAGAMMMCAQRGAKLISCSDQDDIWYPIKLSRMVEKFSSLPPLSVLHCDMHLLCDQEGGFQVSPATAWNVEKRGIHNVTSLDLMIRNVVAGAGMIIDAELVRRYPDYPGEVMLHDHWYPLVASYFGGVHALNEPLYSYRLHGNNVAGLSQYTGFFKPSANSKALGLQKKILITYRGSLGRLQAAQRSSLPVKASDRLIVASRKDLGVGYFFKGLRHLLDDPALARACFARAAGKILSLILNSRT